jgi:hypothetical protein
MTETQGRCQETGDARQAADGRRQVTGDEKRGIGGERSSRHTFHTRRLITTVLDGASSRCVTAAPAKF